MYHCLFIMDPFATLNLATETSLLLMGSLKQRGHAVYWAEWGDVALRDTGLFFRCRSVESIDPFQLGESTWCAASEFHAVVQRKDPPFDAAYLHLTYLLDFLPATVVQFNDAAGVRNNNEKLCTLRWPQFAPPTLVSANLAALKEFVGQHQDVVLKPVEDCSGRGLLRVNSDMFDWVGQLGAFVHPAGAPSRMVIAQRFIPAIKEGDKRIYLCDGEVVGLVNRLPAEGKWLGNIHQGARVEATELNEREKHIVETVTPYLKAQGLFLVGMDVIGGYLTELNVTSPSAIRQINAVMGQSVHEKLAEAMLRQIDKTYVNVTAS